MVPFVSDYASEYIDHCTTCGGGRWGNIISLGSLLRPLSNAQSRQLSLGAVVSKDEPASFPLVSEVNGQDVQRIFIQRNSSLAQSPLTSSFAEGQLAQETDLPGCFGDR